MVSKLLGPLFFAVKKVSFPQSRKFSTKKFSIKKLIKEIFPSKENFPQKGSLKAKNLDPFNNKSHAKIFLTF